MAESCRDRETYNKMFSMLYKRLQDLRCPLHMLKALYCMYELLQLPSTRTRFFNDCIRCKSWLLSLTNYSDEQAKVRSSSNSPLPLHPSHFIPPTS